MKDERYNVSGEGYKLTIAHDFSRIRITRVIAVGTNLSFSFSILIEGKVI